VLPGDITIAVTRDGDVPAQPNRKGRRRTLSSPNSGSGTAPFQIDYVIDAQGRRVGKQVNGALQRQYVWSSNLPIAAELDGTGAVQSRFIYGNALNVPALIVRPTADGERLYRVITDHLGSPVYVVNIADPNDVMLDASYDEWGKVTAYTSSTGAWPIPFGFAGGLYDESTGLVRFGARDYDPRIGRWTSKDPIRFDGGQANLYVYANNDPANFADHDGELPVFVIGFVVGAGLDAAMQYYKYRDFNKLDKSDVLISGAFGSLSGGLGAGLKALEATRLLRLGIGALVGAELGVAKHLFKGATNQIQGEPDEISGASCLTAAAVGAATGGFGQR
jgi:RHS repeat-associated protein